jgi:hypothetical protein
MTREISPAEQALRDGRQATHDRLLLWFRPLHPATGERVDFGLWAGDDHETITVDGAPRLYFGAGTILSTDPVESVVGLDVRMWRAELTDLTAEVATLLQGYEARFAPIEVHLSVHDPVTRARVAVRRVFRGWVDTVEIVRPEEGGSGRATVDCASAMRAMTRTLPQTKSEASMRLRSATDRFGEYRGAVGQWETPWGEKNARGGQ